jgi:SAM-dependent methyltransferase
MDLGPLLAPRDSELLRIARDLYGARPDLRAAFPAVETPAFYQWLGVHGVLEDPRIARFYPALPPAGLRATACGGVALPAHLYSGVEDFRMLAELFELFAQRSITSVRSVLDFGCGCGRALRWFQTALPQAHLHGTDVRAASIAWCRENLAGTYCANGTLPPLPLPDASIDLTYALSVFSHLSREQNIAWMRELARVTKPDGLILVSTHGAFALALCARSPEHQQAFQLSAEEARHILRRLARESFVHLAMPAAIREFADGVADDYGQAFCTEQFARESWAGVVGFLGCVPCGLNLFQDMYALQPRR